MQDVPADSRIVYVSCTQAGYEVLRRLLDEGVPIAEVVTITPDAGARHGVSGYHDFSAVAAERDLPLYYPETYAMDTEADRDHFATLDGDLLIVNGWQRLVPGEIIETFDAGAVGNHGSAFGLPKGRGRSPLNWSLVEDLDRFLISLITLAVEADAGTVVATRKFDVTEFDDIETLYYKIVMTVQEMLLESIGPLLRGEAELREQPGAPTFYPKRNPADGAVNWGDTTRDVYNLVRAVTRPYPGAFTEYDGERIMLWEARPFSDDLALDAAEGEVVQTFETTGEFVVAAADGTLLVTDWTADDWVPERGMRLTSLGENDRVDGFDQRHNLVSAEGR